jgi:hypothetical protein
MAPLSVIAIYGIGGIFLDMDYASLSKWWSRKIKHMHIPSFDFSDKTRFMKKRQLVYLFVIVVLVTTNAVSVYPSHVSLNASYESITHENLSVTEWMRVNLDKINVTIASDHRLARLSEAVGFNTTVNQANIIWSAVNLSDYLDELYGTYTNYSRITHVLIDDIMRERVVHVGFGQITYMTNESYDKFLSQPYELIYRNATVNQDMVETHWTELYRVNWSYIEEFQKTVK